MRHQAHTGLNIEDFEIPLLVPPPHTENPAAWGSRRLSRQRECGFQAEAASGRYLCLQT